MMKKSVYFPISSIITLLFLLSFGTVQATNPIAQDDNNIIAEGASIQVIAPGVLVNDTDPEGGPLTVTTMPITLPTHGTVALSSNGAYTYTHNGSETNSDSFVYEVCDNELLCDTATVSITVVPVNDPPSPVNDSISVAEGSSASQSAPGVLGNDTDAEGDTLTVTTTPITPPDHGSLTLSGDGSFTYTHDGSETTSDSFVYQVCDNGTPSLCVNGTVTINISPVNDAPTAVDDEATVLEGGSLAVPAPGVLANDMDTDVGDALEVNPAAPTVPPQHGITTLNRNGSYTYIHNGSETTSDSFTYRACDSGTPRKCAEAIVFITIEPVNDPPQPQNDTLTVDEGGTAVIPTPGILSNDSDPENGNLTVTTTPISNPSHGNVILQTNGAYTYTHNGDENSSDSFVYQICDDGDPFECGQATVQVTITAVNDPPTVDLNGTSFGTGFNVLFAMSGGAVNITDTDLVVVDPDDTHLETAVVTIVNLQDSAAESLVANTSGTSIVANYNVLQGQLVLTGTDTLANYQRVLRSTTYNNTSPVPNTAARNINFLVNNGALNSNIATSVVSIVNSKIALSVTPERQDVNAGDAAQFTVAITNTGNVPLTNVQVVNTLVDNCDRAIGTLNAGQINTYSCQFPNVTDSFLNQTQVSGIDPLNDTVSDSTTTFVNVTNTILDIIILPTSQDMAYNGTANFSIGILNISSNVDLNNVTVSIPEAPNCNRSLGSLSAGGDAGYSCTLSNITSEVVLLATVTANNANNNSPISATEFAEVQVFDMTVALNANPQTLEQPGGTVQYTVQVVNQSSKEELTLHSLMSEPYGDLTNPDNPLISTTSCAAGVTIGIRGGSYTCAFAVEIFGPVGDYEATVTAVTSDNNNRTLQRNANAIVQIMIQKVYLPVVPNRHSLDEPNNSPCQAYPIGLNTTHKFLANDDNDWYRFVLDKAGQVTIELNNFVPKAGQIWLWSGSCDNLSLISINTITATEKIINLDNRNPDTYHILIVNESDFNFNDLYQLRVYFNYFDGPWEQEDNHDVAQANGRLRSNQPYYGYPDDAKDYFFILLEQPGRIIVDLQNYTSTGQLQLFYQSTNNRVAYATSSPYHLDYTGPAGTYYIYIATTVGHNATTPYTLMVDY